MTGRYPNLRHHSRKRASGKVVTYYFYDRRGTGESDIPLGTDFNVAMQKWDEIHNGKPRIVGTLEEAFAAWEHEALPLYTNAGTRRGYAADLRTMRPAFQGATWDQISLPTIKQYLKKRTAKTRGNREMALLSIIWNWSRGEGYTTLPWPAAGMERSKWKNKEKPRRMKVVDEIWNAIRHEAVRELQDCMDLGTATGMRLTDCIGVLMPPDDILHLEASKTGKEAEWDMSLSATLPELLARRRKLDADHRMLLSLPNGQPVTLSKLRYRWDQARERAAVKASVENDTEKVEKIRAMYLRDVRKRAAQKSGSLTAASELLQHDNPRLTERHYGGVRKLKPAA